jgi:hypothetical protein
MPKNPFLIDKANKCLFFSQKLEREHFSYRNCFKSVLNCDYKIISKLLAERLKNVLTKLIHPNQKGFVKGRNISEINRMIQDIIQYADEENEVSIIVFLDQQKTFDRVEWGWETSC